ncbi:flagellar biosynthesis protein FlhF [Malikia spinosa]|uniref:Flagellar biosynthesis protein FlhF n=1 Tax=Malikia spinosa TaxID=86180 RepID=A0A2S9KDB0_9BURK|nr:flagellar biosynthesis protein FlhF [Malikia spinosa]OGB69651.1 MAG: flagellar biosynthesis protein FlhF [Burkholderiales bacterium RIFOXYC12_FULL_65_23]PRD68428.1 flagellar biosynthesis protein FlhF [Malikia spinosa]
MKVHRFIASSAREALGLVREALGPEAMILANRSAEAGIEILACSERDYATVIEQYRDDDADPALAAPAPAPVPAADPGPGMSVVMEEIRAMREALAKQMNELAWSGQQQPKNPLKSAMLKHLLSLGLSPSLTRYLTENAPGEGDLEQAIEWSKGILTRNINVLQDEDSFLDEGGVYALIGPTGVGKTTTTAKLAARYVMRHGPGKLALITTDGYRIGAHEQLRIYGKIMGVMVHSVKDEVDLRLALEELATKHTVLIDTVGMSQRDQMVAEQIAMLAGTQVPVKRLLCLNTTSTIETLNEVVHAYRGSGLEGVILTKLDEAVTISNALDVVIRQKLRLFYLGTGQRVPEDLQLAQARPLVERVFELRSSQSSKHYEDSELPVLMSTDAVRLDTSVQGIKIA